jgi:glucose-1-phosphate adenylyltransferase
VTTDASGRIVRFEEKTALPATIPGRPDLALASMGIYVFDTSGLVEALQRDVAGADADDFGRHILPRMVDEGWAVHAFEVPTAGRDQPFYWADVGLIDRYWEASMRLLAPEPLIDLWDPYWRAPISTGRTLASLRPACADGQVRTSHAIVGPGVLADGAEVENSILSPGVSLGPGAEVRDSIIMAGVRIGPGTRVHRAIIDEGASIAAGCDVGLNPEEDARRFHVSPGGIAVVPARTRVQRTRREPDRGAITPVACGPD